MTSLRERKKEDVDKFNLSKVCQRVNGLFLCPRPNRKCEKCVNSFFFFVFVWMLTY